MATPKNGRLGSGAGSTQNVWEDPSENVKALNEAANRRQDDLREAADRLVDYRLDHTEKMAALRAEHAKEIREIETNRLNAIRQVDVLAVSTAADRAQAAIQALAATAAADAQKLRDTLQSTAQAAATSLANTLGTITERIAALEKSSYEGKGKQALADPALEQLVQEVKNLAISRDTIKGRDTGIGLVWGIIVAVVGMLGGGGLVALIAIFSK